MATSTSILCLVVLMMVGIHQGVAQVTFLSTTSSAPCGQAGQSCCSGACNAGMYCDKNSGNTCQYNCGGVGQYCCSKSASGGCNGKNLFCQAGIGSEKGYNYCIENCGRKGQKCCRNKWCAGGFYCDSTLQCKPCTKKVGCPNGPKACGNPGEPCCKNKSCVAGTFCDTTSIAGQQVCRPYCGAAGQRCCPVKSKGYDGCNKNEGVYCDDSASTSGTGGTGLCTYNCGFEGQQCCPRGWCSSGLNCNNAKCAKQVTCGGANQGCCNSGNKCIKGYFCFQGMCRQNCGKPGQPCCVYDKNWCQSNYCRSDGKCE